MDFDPDWGKSDEDEVFLCAFPQCGFEAGGQSKRREIGAKKLRRDFDLQSKRENRDSFGCQWKLEGLDMPKDGLL